MRLEDLLDGLHATSVSLIRFEHESASFDVVASAGRPFLAPGVQLPIAASMVAQEASEGRSRHLSASQSWYPLDRVAISVGLRCAYGVPLMVGDRAVGALTARWEVDPPPVTDPAAIVDDSAEELLHAVISFERRRRRLLVCHEDRLLAAGLAHVAEQALGVSAFVAHTVDEALAEIDLREADLIVLSDGISADRGLLESARSLRAGGATAPLLVVARTDSEQSFQNALQAGATGYLPLAGAADTLPETAAALFDGRSVLSPTRSAPPGPHLTEREYQVLLCFEQGLADKQIARQLGVAISTVKTHARAIYAKLDAPSRTAALHKAREAGLI